MSDGVDIGALSGRIEFEDLTSRKLDEVIVRLGDIDRKFGDTHDSVLHMAEGVFSGEAALEALKKVGEEVIETLKDMTIEGAGLADIRDNFVHLTESAGQFGETLLTTLRQGTHNTIDDLELMKIVNKDLAAGMNLTNDQFEVLTKGAFALAQATGTDVKTAFETVNDAMLTGRTRAVAMLTGRIDLAAAEDTFARKLGTTADRLNEEGKTEAARQAILEKVGQATERLGEQTDGLDEKAAQAQATWKNFYDDLSMSIGTSQSIGNAIDAVEGALGRAFGSDKQQAIEKITDMVDGFFDAVTTYGPPVIEVIGSITSKLAEIGRLSLREAQDEVQELALVVQGYSISEAESMVETTKVTEALLAEERARKRAADATAAHAEETRKVTEAQEKHVSVEDKNKFIIEQTADELKNQKEAMDELASVTGGYQDIIDSLDGSMVEAIKYYLEAGVAQDKLATIYGLTATQVGAVAQALKDETQAQKLEEKATLDSIDRWSQYYAERRAMSGTATDKMVADIDSWTAAQIHSHQAAKIDTADFYTWLDAERKQSFEHAEQQRLEEDQHSKAFFDKVARDAADAYDFARAHSDQFTEEYIENLRRTKDAATDAAIHWRDTLGKELEAEVDDVIKLGDATLRLGGQVKVTSQNFADALHSANTNGGFTMGHFDEMYGMRLAKAGYSFQEILDILNSSSNGPIPPPQGPRIPGFREGGVGDFGDGTMAMLHGKEAIVPLEGNVPAGLGGQTIHNHFYVNGTAEDVAHKISDIIMGKLKLNRQFGAAS